MKVNTVYKWFLLVLLNPMLLNADESKKTDEDINPAEWGIHNDCIRTTRIKSLKFVDETSALIEISDGKTIMMKLKGRCPGVKNHGIAYKTQTGTLCARVDYVTSIQSRFHCQIESFEPYLTLDDPSADIDEAEEEEEETDGEKTEKDK